MFAQLPPYLLYLLTVAASFLISLAFVPQIISMAAKRQLFDSPDADRKFHSKTTPNLGGIAIFFAYIIVCSLVVQPSAFDKWHYLIASSLLFFITGIVDDILQLSSGKKLLAQLIPIAIVVFMADIRIQSLHGLFGIGELSYWSSAILSLGTLTFFTNAFNFIDGIDGLAGSTGILYTFTLGTCLALTGNSGAACIAFALMGATAGFLKYNITPARIFMGDTGSLLLGFTIAVLSILFVNSYDSSTAINELIANPQAAILFMVAVLSVPVADCLRVFISRMRRGLSPFRADRRHLHYYLLDLGLTHPQAVVVIVAVNIIMMGTALALQHKDWPVVVTALAGLTVALFSILYFLKKQHTSLKKETGIPMNAGNK